MVFNATVLYPAESDSTFDLSYYLKSHFPIVDKNWGPFGLKEWKVIEFAAGPDGKKPYSIGAVLTWESEDGLKQALGGEEAKNVLGDVPNFSNKSPVFLMGNVVGSS